MKCIYCRWPLELVKYQDCYSNPLPLWEAQCSQRRTALNPTGCPGPWRHCAGLQSERPLRSPLEAICNK